jgi:hypothetical protein
VVVVDINITGVGIAAASGISLSLIISFLKGEPFKLRGENAKLIVIVGGFLYFVVTATLYQLGSAVSFNSILNSLINGLASGFALVFSAEGLYQKVQRAEKES